MEKPRESHNSVYLRWIGAVFIFLALSFFFDFWGNQREVIQNDLVDPEYFSTQTVRQPKLEPLINKGGEVYRCSDCHQHLSASDVQKSFFSAHEDIVLEHGANNYCATCHSSTNKDFLLDINKQDISFSKSEFTCRQCHGTQYRDWTHGVHGRINGYWDKTKGEMTRVTCVACHDPHHPKFQPIKPSPPPAMWQYLDQIRLKEDPHG